MKYDKSPMDTLREHAINVSVVALKNMNDKGGFPMTAHAARVAGLTKTVEESIVAYLHDVVEDTDYTIAEMSLLFPQWVVVAIEILTKRESEPYFDYINRVATSGNGIALAVKLADIEDHLKRKQYISESLIKRYEKARDNLCAVV